MNDEFSDVTMTTEPWVEFAGRIRNLNLKVPKVKTLSFSGVIMVKENFTLTEDMKFGNAQIVSILAYSVMFIIGITANTLSLIRLITTNWKDKSRMKLLLIHLSIADLTVRNVQF